MRDVCKGPETVIWLMGINQVETLGLGGVIQMFWPSDSNSNIKVVGVMLTKEENRNWFPNNKARRIFDEHVYDFHTDFLIAFAG